MQKCIILDSPIFIARIKQWIVTLIATVPVSRSRTQSFQANRLIVFQVGVVLKTLISLIGLLEPCSARIYAHRQTDRLTDNGHTHRPTTVTLAADARRGLKRCTNEITALTMAQNYGTDLPSYACACTLAIRRENQLFVHKSSSNCYLYSYTFYIHWFSLR